MKEVIDFQKRVYELMTKIPRGKVTTYGELAKAMGGSKFSRAVGNAARDNPFAPKVPCHRVIRSSGDIGGFSGETSGENVERKIKMLREEGVSVDSAGRIDLRKYLVKGEDLRKATQH
ncbi:MAG: MGMT family protein [Promethearchaeati archaeon SRVP18_Atabeyarchaeia-1]